MPTVPTHNDFETGRLPAPRSMTVQLQLQAADALLLLQLLLLRARMSTTTLPSARCIGDGQQTSSASVPDLESTVPSF